MSDDGEDSKPATLGSFSSRSDDDATENTIELNGVRIRIDSKFSTHSTARTLTGFSAVHKSENNHTGSSSVLNLEEGKGGAIREPIYVTEYRVSRFGPFKLFALLVMTLAATTIFAIVLTSDFSVVPEVPTTDAPTTTTSPPTQSLVILPAKNEGFKIDLLFVEGEPESAILDSFTEAAAKWSEILSETDWINLNFTVDANLGPACDLDGPVIVPAGFLLHDLLILVSVGPIDGNGDEGGNILGFANNCVFYPERDGDENDRNNALRPRVGTMRFDSFDLYNLDQEGTLGTVILHEMGHVLGIGTLWDVAFRSSEFEYNFLDKSLLNDPRYTGTGGIEGQRRITGSDNSTSVRPKVEADGGAGTAYGHWDESEYGNELMTGFIDPGISPLSALTALSMSDLGYKVNLDAIDSYSVKEANTVAKRGGVRSKMYHDFARSTPVHVDSVLPGVRAAKDESSL